MLLEMKVRTLRSESVTLTYTMLKEAKTFFIDYVDSCHTYYLESFSNIVFVSSSVKGRMITPM